AELEVRLSRAQAERDDLKSLNGVLRAERTQLMGKLLEATRIHGAGKKAAHAEEGDGEEAGHGIDLASFISQLRSEALDQAERAAPALAAQAAAVQAAAVQASAAQGPAQPAAPALAAAAPRPTFASAFAAPAAAPAARFASAFAPPAPARVAVAVRPATPGATAASLAPAAAGSVLEHAQRLQQEGRLEVSAQELAELSGQPAYAGVGGGAGNLDETLFGFSLRELATPDPGARIRAAERLRALGQTAAAPALATALHAEEDPAAQVALLQAFAAVGRAQGAEVVRPLLGSPASEVRIAALKALLHLTPAEAAPYLAQAMKDPDRAVRRRASLLALGLEGESARRLGEEAIQDADPEVRSLAALALGAGRGERARELLLGALRDSEPRVRKAAAQSLSRILGQDVSGVVALDEGHRRREIRRLATLPSHPVRASSVRPKPPLPLGEGSAPKPVPPMTPRETAPSAPEAPAPRAAGPSPVEALCAPLMGDIRAALRGRSLPELVSGASASDTLVQEALTLLVARGAVVRRGHKYYAA
ncbi:MAG TPA: HEAT repeat domain-containing protein, partial [Aggregicoccus sp.]|nr:HEAT repeat domain-containing protein [Aggregicoccus sp.]